MPGDLVRTNWERDEVHRVFDTLEFRVLRDRLYATVEAATPEADEGFEVTFQLLGPGEVAPWLDAHARTGARTGVHISGFWGAGSGDVTGVALATADGEGGWFAPEDLDPADEQAVAGVAGRRVGTQGAARREGSDAGVRGPRLGAARRHQRHRAVGVPRDARPAQLRPGRPRAALPAPRAAGRGGRRRRTAGVRPRRRRRHRGRRVRRAAGPGRLRAGRRPRHRAGEQGGHRAAARPRAAAGRRAGRHGARRHRGRHRAPRRTWSRSSAAR